MMLLNKGWTLSPEELEALMLVAQGKEKADVVLMGGSVVNVYTGEILENTSIAIKGERIAYIGSKIESLIGDKTLVIDARNKVIAPGFIESHTHMLNYLTPADFLMLAVPGGTTTVVTESMDISFVAGYRGVLEFLKSLLNQPIKIFATVPAMISLSQANVKRSFDARALKRLLRRKEVVGLGETYWAPLVQGDKRLLQVFSLAQKSGKILDGHAAGARDGKLQAYVAAGISSDHEPITVAEVLERMRLGLYVLVREGDVRRDLEEVAKIAKEKLDFRRLCLCTDTVYAKTLLERGYMESLVQKAIDVGFDPIVAIQMATINIAERFNLDNILGGLAPGKFADMVVLPDLKHIKAEIVLSNGKIVAREGKMLARPRRHRYPQWMKKTLSFSRPAIPEDFNLKVESSSGTVKVRVIKMATGLVTEQLILELPVLYGKLESRPEQDLLKVAILDGKEGPQKRFAGLVQGFGLKKGALATNSAWDILGIIVIGVSEQDMALAVNRVIEMGGGTVFCLEGRVLAEFSTPIGGLISEEPADIQTKSMAKIQKELAACGVPWSDGYQTLSVLSTPAIPFLRIFEDGLYDIRENKVVPLFVD